jgi:hypothetical protein
MNLPPESGQAGRSSTSSMNGRIPLGGFGRPDLPQQDQSDLPYSPPMQKTSGSGIGASWGQSGGFLAFPGSPADGFSAWG